MEGAFSGSGELVIRALDEPNLSIVSDMSSMFSGRTYVTGDIGGWDVSNVTDMSQMFMYSGFNGDISSWDVSNAKYYSNVFYLGFNPAFKPRFP